MNRSLKQQRGVALITAVLVVALVTAAAVAMASRQQLDVRRTANIFSADQAYQTVLAGEDYARNFLALDRKDNKVDHLGEAWAEPQVFPFEDMVLSGQLEDLQGRFNLNNLLTNEGDVSQDDLAIFKRLLSEQGVDTEVAQAVLDWMDEDIDPRMGGGAEDDLYMQKVPAYRAANRKFVSVSELRLIEGMSDESYPALEPFLAALPQRTKINVNTALPEVLSALSENLDGSVIAEARKDKEYETVQSFLSSPDVQNHNIKEDILDVQSDYFLLSAMAEFDGARSILFSVLSRGESGKVSVVTRGRGAY